MYGFFCLHEHTLSLKSEPWRPSVTAAGARLARGLRLEVEIQDDADDANHTEYRRPNQRV